MSSPCGLFVCMCFTVVTAMVGVCDRFSLLAVKPMTRLLRSKTGVCGFYSAYPPPPPPQKQKTKKRENYSHAKFYSLSNVRATQRHYTSRIDAALSLGSSLPDWVGNTTACRGSSVAHCGLWSSARERHTHVIGGTRSKRSLVATKPTVTVDGVLYIHFHLQSLVKLSLKFYMKLSGVF